MAATTRIAGKGGAARATKFFSEGKKPGESKLSRVEQKDKASEVSKSKNCTKCRRGEKLEKQMAALW
jgi:hypothetical protein